MIDCGATPLDDDFSRAGTTLITGHAGLALGARGLRRDLPLVLLLLAAYAPDVVQVALDAAGLDGTTSALWSHSIAAGAVLAVACAVLAWRVVGDRGAAGAAGGLVVLHLLADYVTGQKPTWAHGPIIGLHLYAHPARDLAVEAVVVVAGWLLVRRSSSTAPRRPIATVGALALLLAIQIAADARLRFGIRLRWWSA